MKEIKKLVDELHLEKYYGDFERNDDSYMYMVELYAYKIDNVIYIGNRQIPIDPKYDYKVVKYDMANYWLNGSCDIYTVLYRYDKTSNSMYDKEYKTGNKLANQKTLNKIKKLIIDKCNTNFNVQILPENYDIVEQIGKQIAEWKHNIFKSLKEYDIDTMRNDLIEILNLIKSDYNKWHKYLITKNRYWFISIEDAEERSEIMFDSLTTEQKALLIVMKEWLAMIVNESSFNTAYNMHIDKVLYKLKNTYYKNVDLFEDSKTKFFQHKTSIKIILSLMYNASTNKNIEDTYDKFMRWRNEYNKKIFYNQI